MHFEILLCRVDNIHVNNNHIFSLDSYYEKFKKNIHFVIKSYTAFNSWRTLLMISCWVTSQKENKSLRITKTLIIWNRDGELLSSPQNSMLAIFCLHYQVHRPFLCRVLGTVFRRSCILKDRRPSAPNRGRG